MTIKLTRSLTHLQQSGILEDDNCPADVFPQRLLSASVNRVVCDQLIEHVSPPVESKALTSLNLSADISIKLEDVTSSLRRQNMKTT